MMIATSGAKKKTLSCLPAAGYHNVTQNTVEILSLDGVASFRANRGSETIASVSD
jgi:hypothetical protein